MKTPQEKAAKKLADRISVEIRDTEIANEAPENIEKYIAKKLKASTPEGREGRFSKVRDVVNQKYIYVWVDDPPPAK